MTPRLRVLFVHGKESSPHGTKAQYLSEHFDVHGEQMDTSDFPGSVALQAQAIARFRPDVVVGSSYGGAVACALLQAGHFRGATLLLAPATRLYDPEARLPANVPVVIVHGEHDQVVPLPLGERLAATGTPEYTVFHRVEDDHRLSATVAAGKLPAYVWEAYRCYATHIAR